MSGRDSDTSDTPGGFRGPRLQGAGARARPLWTPPTSQEFNNEWLTPDDAAGGLTGRLEDHPKKRWLLDRLKIGAIIGVARQADEGDGKLTDLVPVPIKNWKLWDNCGDDQFWEFGDARFTISHPMSASLGGYGPSSFHIEQYLDVRFHPDDLSGGVRKRPIPDQPGDPPRHDPPGDPVSPEDLDRRKFPRLSDPRLSEWHALFLSVYPDGNATLAQESVNGMFPKHHVARTRIRELFPNVPVGRPREIKE